MAAALMAQRTRRPGLPLSDEVGAAVVVVAGALRHEAVASLLAGGLEQLEVLWGVDRGALDELARCLRSVVGPPATFGPGFPPRGWVPPGGGPRARGCLATFAHVQTAFSGALAAGWPWRLALNLFASLGKGRLVCGGTLFVTEAGDLLTEERIQKGDWLVSDLGGTPGAGPPLQIHFSDAAILFVASRASLQVEAPVRPTRRARAASGTSDGVVPVRRTYSGTLWLPPYVRLPREGPPGKERLVVPRDLTVSIVERRHEWLRLIPNMDGVTRACVFGKMTYPRSVWRVRPSWKPNHASWEQNEEAKRMLGGKLALWFLSGALEYIRPGLPPPVIVEPIGQVPKKGPDKYRLITDAREGNESIEDWGVHYFSARDLAMGLSPKAIVCGSDFADAYHISKFGGCTGELVWTWGVVNVDRVYPGDPRYPTLEEAIPGPGQDGPGDPIEMLVFGWRLVVGCSPETCMGTCDKAMNGMEFDGCLARWAAAHFGQKPAGSPLNSCGLCLLRYIATRRPPPGERRGASSNTGLGVLWVDDVTLWRPVPLHGACLGLEGNCPVCLAALPGAERMEADWIELCTRLGVRLNMDKRQWCAQRVEFAGFLFDTLRGLLRILPDKLAKLLAALAEWLAATCVTPRELDSLRGRVLHYSAAIRHLRVHATALGRFVGPVDDDAYDRPVAVTDEMRQLGGEVVDVIERYHDRGMPLWPPVASTLYRLMLDQRAGAPVFALTWDASPDGWAALLRWWDLDQAGGEPRTQLLVGTWPPGAEVAEQAHREALAAPLALEAACARVALGGMVGIFRNDAAAAIGALRKGCSKSAVMHDAARRFNRVCAREDIDPLLWHVSGLRLVEEGIDGASRGGTDFGPDANVESVLGPRATDALWERIRQAAASAGWAVTIDLFASAANARAARFCSRFPEPHAEAFDAFSVLSWAHSRCPQCGQWHAEVAYAFPPPAMVRATVRKAMADGARILLVVPVAILAPYWHKLVAASVLTRHPAKDGFVRIKHAHRYLTDAAGYEPRELAIFACDFSALAPDHSPPGGATPPCAGAFARRPRHRCGSADDLRDRLALREAMEAQGWTVSCAEPGGCACGRSAPG